MAGVAEVKSFGPDGAAVVVVDDVVDELEVLEDDDGPVVLGVEVDDDGGDRPRVCFP